MKARGIWFLIVLLLALTACAPVASAPTGGAGTRTCRWVREAVKQGHMPVDQAWAWYAHCAPFEVPQ